MEDFSRTQVGHLSGDRFPAVGLGVALVAGGALGAGAGAVKGHITRGMPQADLEELGRVLDNGTSGLLVVAATELEDSVAGATTRSNTQARGQLHTDLDTLKQELAHAVV